MSLSGSKQQLLKLGGGPKSLLPLRFKYSAHGIVLFGYGVARKLKLVVANCQLFQWTREVDAVLTVLSSG